MDVKIDSDAIARDDLKSVLLDAQNLAKCGEYAEALRKYRWFFENALAYDPTWCGVRTSFALSSWAQLGDVYPPARAELESIKEAKALALRHGATEKQLFSDVAAINCVLGLAHCTSDLFVEIAESNGSLPKYASRWPELQLSRPATTN